MLILFFFLVKQRGFSEVPDTDTHKDTYTQTETDRHTYPQIQTDKQIHKRTQNYKHMEKIIQIDI